MRRCARREIDQIISLNRGRVSFHSLPLSSSARARASHGARRSLLSYVVFFQLAGDRIIAPAESLSLPPSPLPGPCAHRERRVYFANIRRVRVHTATRQTDWSWGSVGGHSILFAGPRALKKNCSRGKVRWNLVSESRRTFLSRCGYRYIACLESSSENDLTLSIKSNEVRKSGLNFRASSRFFDIIPHSDRRINIWTLITKLKRPR